MLLRRIARPLLAGIFISGGIAALRDPKSHAELVGPVLEPTVDKVADKVPDSVSDRVPVESSPSTITLVKVDAGVKIGAGLLLAIGKAPRLAAGTLAATLVPTTAFGHRFWEIDDPQERANQQSHFAKNLALLGGLMLASADTEGKPSLAWRARRAGQTSAATAELFHRDITDGVSELSKRAGEFTGAATDTASKYGSQAVELASKYGPQAADVAGKYGSQAAELAARYRPQAAELAGRAGKKLAKRRERARAEAEKLAARAGKRAEKAAKRARKAGKQAKKTGRKASKRLSA